jgi:cell division protein FtsL
MGRTPGLTEVSEFAVPKDVENHPVREVDRGRQRELGWWLLGAGLAVGGLLLLAWQHYEWIRLGYRMDELKKAAAVEETTRRHLLLEVATLRSPQRIEEIATGQLHMVMPKQTEAVVITRIRQGAAPAKTLVALR